MDARQLVVTGPRTVIVEDVRLSKREGAVVVRMCYSGISAGTELSVVKGSNVRLDSDAWIPAGEPALGRIPSLTYPVRDLGYMEVGEIIESEAVDFPIGARVALACGHKTAATVIPRPGSIVVMPDDIKLLHSIWISNLLPICANGLLHAAAEFRPSGGGKLESGIAGRRIVVVGAGVIGLVLAYWAAQLGAEIVVVDRTWSRLLADRSLGLEVLLDEGEAAWIIRSRWRNGGADSGADLVFQTRGTTAALTLALRSVRPGHPVIDLAFYQSDAGGLHLGEDFHHAGITLRAAQIGNIPRVFKPTWNRERLVDEGVDFLRASGEVLEKVLITDVVAFEEAPTLLTRMAEDKSGATLQAVLTFD
jgi:threonine dehydrogenase-like Zn-dependent dehydrogenase